MRSLPLMVACLVMEAFLSFSSGFALQQTEPATAVQAAEVLDLSKFPMVDLVEDSQTAVIGSQSYLSTGKVLEVAKKTGQYLKDMGWEEMDGATYSEEYASAIFQKSGFTISASVFNAGADGRCQVTITNHGNVDLKQLPVPEGTRELFATPINISYVTAASTGEASRDCKRLLLEQGWEPFGETTVSFFVKKNAIRIQVMVGETPADGGKTAIQIFCEQLSFDLPAPPSATGLTFSDPTGQMMFDSEQSQAEVVDWFRKKLADSNWKPATDNPVKIDFREILVFRNPSGEVIEIAFSGFEGKTRVALEYQSAAKVEATAQKAAKQSEQMKTEREAAMAQKMNPAKLQLDAPAGANVRECTGKRCEFSIATGKAKAATANWIAKMETEGWKSEAIIDGKEAGEFELTKDGVRLTAGFIDPGFIEGAITITVWGDYQLELSK